MRRCAWQRREAGRGREGAYRCIVIPRLDDDAWLGGVCLLCQSFLSDPSQVLDVFLSPKEWHTGVVKEIIKKTEPDSISARIQ